MTILLDIQQNKANIIDLTARDLDENAHEFAKAIRRNTRATQLILALCDFNDETFDILVDAICERENKFIYIDISLNQYLSKKSYDSFCKLINSKKVDELNIASIQSITSNINYMMNLTELTKANSVILYVDDKARAELQLPSDKALMNNSIFKPRDFRVVTQELFQNLSDFDIFSKILPKLSNFMIITLYDAVQKIYSSKLEEKEDKKNNIEKQILIDYFKNAIKLQNVIDELPLFIRYKLIDVIQENRLEGKTSNRP